MDVEFRLLSQDDITSVVDLSLLAWAPVFDSFRQVLGPTIYDRVYPDWRKQQSEGVEGVCQAQDMTTWVATVGPLVVGFIAYKLDFQNLSGEVELLAVHPDFQNQGIGTELNELALRKMRDEGIKVVAVGTGGDPGHAPARRSYEKAGYTALPLVRYYQAL